MVNEEFERVKKALADATVTFQDLEAEKNRRERDAMEAWRAKNAPLYSRLRNAEAQMNEAAIALNAFAAAARRLASKQSGVVGRIAITTTKKGATRRGVIEIFDEKKDRPVRGMYIWDGELVLRVLEKGTDKRTGEVYRLGRFTADDLSSFAASQLPNGWTFEPVSG